MTASSRLGALSLVAAAALLAASAQAADHVKVGLMSTLSGPGAGLGVDIRDGFQLAMKHNGGKLGTLPAEVIVVDDQMSPDAAKQTAERLIKRDNVDFMTGVVFSNIMLAVAPAVFQSKTFYLSANAGPSQLAGAQCNPYFFSVSYQNDNMHEAVGAVNGGRRSPARPQPPGRQGCAGRLKRY
jgi:branched-chain amino acid transport system substrate-binding protein